MSSPTSRDSMQALPDWSAVPSNSEEDRKLVSQRIAYFAAVAGIVSACFYAFVSVLAVIITPSWREQLLHPSSIMHLAAAAVYGLMWLSCQSGQRSSRQLNVIHVTGVVAASVLYALMVVLAPDVNFAQSLILTLIAVSTMTMNAIVVPATARRTVWLTTLACAPVPVAAYIVATRNPAERLAGQVWASVAATAFIGMWCLSCIAISALASRIIYGLQQRVRAATELGQYTLEEKIGEGGMGAVYRARHALLRRPTAIKLLSNGRRDERQIERFEREVQMTALLTHPNTIAIYDFGRTPDGVFYYAMEFVEGITLEELVAHDGPQPARRVVHLMSQVCAALAEAHERGLVHRDIKPANIMFSMRGGAPDHVKVLDFGLVKELEQPDAGTTAQNTLLGTPLYLAPEAISDPTAVGPAADLYAVGAVAYQLLTGHPPFEGKTIVEVCSKHLLAEPPPLAAHGVDAPSSLETALFACLAKKPEARPASAQRLRELFEAAELGARWTSDEAGAWWAAEGPRIMATTRAERANSSSGPRATIAIDLAGRSLVESDVLRQML